MGPVKNFHSAGHIYKVYFVQCGICKREVKLFGDGKTGATTSARRLFWKQTKKRGWICPTCQGEMARVM